MNKIEKLKRIDDYINWLKVEENYKNMQKRRFMYKDEYMRFLTETAKECIIRDYPLSETSKEILNEFENVVKNK